LGVIVELLNQLQTELNEKLTQGMQRKYFFGIVLFFLLIAFFLGKKFVLEDNATSEKIETQYGEQKLLNKHSKAEFEEELVQLRNALDGGDYFSAVSEAQLIQSGGEQLWELALQQQNIPEDVRKAILVEAIRILLNEESATDIIGRINQSLNPGSTRLSVIAMTFQLSSLSPDQFDFAITKLVLPQEKTAASKNYGISLSWKKLNDIDELRELIGKSSFGRSAALSALSAHSTALRGEPMSAIETRLRNSFETVQKLLEGGMVDQEFYQEFIAKISKKAPMETFEYLQQAENLNEVSDEALDSLAASMISRDVYGLLDAIIANQESMGRINVKNAFLKFIHNDSFRAVDFLENNQHNFNEIQQSQALQAISEFSTSAGEFDSAWHWAGRIEDAGVKRKAEGKIWQAEKKIIDYQAKENPAAIAGEIVSGNSIHADFWIADVYQEWTKTSPDAAATWYEENRQTMTPEQNQHVARVYAEQAIESGDLNLAKQWAGEVIEEKFTKKLQEKISAAEAAEK
jgi:hypothetical protein